MGSTLEHGIYLPSEGEKNCYSGLANNWQTVDTNIGYVTALRQAIAGALTRQIVTQLPTEDIDTNCIYMILKATAQTSNIYDEYMYINSNWELIGDSQLDLSNYYTKQEVNQLPAVASGVTSTKVGNYDAHIADGDIHVTTSDKAKWNTVALIKQLRLVNTQVGSATTIAFANIDDTNGIKVGDKCMDLDGKMFEITAVDTTNQTVTVGSALIDLALDSNVMHLSGDETAPGKKTFADLTTFNSWLYFTNSSVTKGTIPQSTVNPYRFCFGSGVNYDASLFNIDTSVSNLGVQTLTFRAAENVVSGDDARLMLIYDPNRAQPKYLSLKGDIEPNANNTYECGSNSNIWKNLYSYHGYFCGQQKGDEFSGNARTALTLLANRDTLGQSGVCISKFRQNRAQGSMSGTDVVQVTFDVLENSVRSNRLWYLNWVDWENDVPKTVEVRSFCEKVDYKLTHINNKNPGSLSLPDLNNGLDISGYFTVGTTSNTYTALADGYISILTTSSSNSAIYWSDSNGIIGDTAFSAVDLGGINRVTNITFPVNRGVTYIIVFKSVNTIVSAKFYPCLGNV